MKEEIRIFVDFDRPIDSAWRASIRAMLDSLDDAERRDLLWRLLYEQHAEIMVEAPGTETPKEDRP